MNPHSRFRLVVESHTKTQGTKYLNKVLDVRFQNNIRYKAQPVTFVAKSPSDYSKMA